MGIQTRAVWLQGPHSPHSSVLSLCFQSVWHRVDAPSIVCKIKVLWSNCSLVRASCLLCLLPLLLAPMTMPRAWSCSCGTIHKCSSCFCSTVPLLPPFQDPGLTPLLPASPPNKQPFTLHVNTSNSPAFALSHCLMPCDGFPEDIKNLWFSRGALGWFWKKWGRENRHIQGFNDQTQEALQVPKCLLGKEIEFIDWNFSTD